MKKGYLLALMALVSATAASAADKQDNQDQAAAAEQKASKAEKPKKEKLICHTEKVLGSLTRVNRICHTEAEWRQIEQTSNKELNDIQQRSGQGVQGSNPLGG